MSKYDWDKGFTVDFSLLNGLSRTGESTKRKLSQMKDMYVDSDAAQKAVGEGDPLVYEFFELGAPVNTGDIAFGTSITYPGKVGKEYFMTKGHFHSILETAEAYFTLSGKGYMLCENPDGDARPFELKPGVAVYVPKRYAHRSINTGTTPLVTFFAFRADAGHDYGTIETKGFRNLVIEGDNGKPEIVINPKWK